MKTKHIECLDGKIGTIFSEFLTNIIQSSYDGLRGKINLKFYLVNDKALTRPSAYTKKVIIKDFTIKDARIGEYNFKKNARLVIELEKQQGMEYAGVYISELIISELIEKLKDVLYVQELEKRISRLESEKANLCNGLKHSYKDSLIKYFIKNILDENWLLENYKKLLIQKYELPNLDLFVQISAQLYEKRPLKTRIYFFDNHEDMEKCSVKLKRHDIHDETTNFDLKLEEHNLRTIRKMLEMAGENHGLFVDKKFLHIRGVVKDSNIRQSLYIEFDGYLKWRICIKDNLLLEYKDGNYEIPMLHKNRSKDIWKDELKRYVERYPVIKISEEVIKQLIKYQTHGTAAVFMNDELLEYEMERLERYKRVYIIDKMDLDNVRGELAGITAIDGALLFDISGNCRAVGAILDGVSVKIGNPGRGSRYNSVVNYIGWLKNREDSELVEQKICFALIISEDGMVDFAIPDDKTDE